MTKQNAIETVTSYFEEIDTRALVLDLKTTKDAEADYEASKYLFGDQDPESEPLENHEDLLEENEKLLIEYYKKQPEEFFAEWNEGNLLGNWLSGYWQTTYALLCQTETKVIKADGKRVGFGNDF